PGRAGLVYNYRAIRQGRAFFLDFRAGPARPEFLFWPERTGLDQVAHIYSSNG
ncbi:hypothetical protein TorRG33x02_257710, partial [Trema orientale]